MIRVPSMDSALTRLKDGGVEIGTVVDIGILKGTKFLTRAFPRANHHLFEPVIDYVDVIHETYRDIPHELHHVAVSSSTGIAFQVGVSADGSPQVTHSYISERQIPIGQVTNQGIVQQCTTIEKVTLDSFFASRTLEPGYLVKIDTDGHEIPIINGGGRIIGGADIVIVEAAMHALPERTNAIANLGFQLMEIVDLAYYHGLLAQVDLIFASNAAIWKHPNLRPWSSKEFTFDQWQPFKC